jgi:FtsH-binding integral membrane protein
VSGGVFISYRRDDSASAARLIFDHLANSLGHEGLFFDVDSIELGVDWVDLLTKRVGECDSLIAVIGKNWASSIDKNSRRRLDDPRDLVRIEIQAALERNVYVIPVLVDGGAMPRAEDLPEGLKNLARRQGIEISHTRFNADVERLTRALLRQREATEAKRAREKRERQEAGEAAERAEQARRLAEVEARHADEERPRQEAKAKRETEERARLREHALTDKRAESEARKREDAERQRGTPAPTTVTTPTQALEKVKSDQGLRAYTIGVYNYMTLGLGVTGLVAWLAFQFGTVQTEAGRLMLTDFGRAIYVSPLRWVIVLVPLAVVFWLSARINSMSVATARSAFLAFAALIGLSMSALLVVYTGASLARAFFATAAAFASLSLYGYTTQRDLSAMGSFMMMGVVGLIVASLLNLFLLHSTGLQFALSILCVIIFAGLTAWDTQAIKAMYYAGDSYEVAHKKSIHGALRLYLDFINMFHAILMLKGSQRNN